MSNSSEIQAQLDSFGNTYNIGSGVSTTTTTAARVAGIIPAGGIGTAAGGWDTSVNRDTAIATINEMKDTINNTRVDFDNLKDQFSRLIETLRERNLIPE